MKTAAVIQARMGSTRLPGKVLMPLAGRPLLQRICERVSTAESLNSVCVATTENREDDAVEELCATIGVPCVRGDEHDVLGRMLKAAKNLGADVLVRLTGDNPMVDATLIDWLFEAFDAADPAPDYVANFGQSPEETGFPYGLYAEIVTVAALEKCLPEATAEDREHVTWYIRTHPQDFNVVKISAPGKFGYKSLTVDTMDDYAAVSEIFEKHHAEKPDFGFRDLMTPGGRPTILPAQAGGAGA